MTRPANIHEQHANSSWLYRAPSVLASTLLGLLIVSSQLSPNDTVVAICNGDSLLFMVGSLGLGVFALADLILNWSRDTKSTGQVPRLTFTFAVVCVVFCLWLWIATRTCVGRQNVRTAYLGCWQWIAHVILLLAVVRVCRCSASAKTLLAMMIACCVGTVGYGYFQYFVTMPQDRSRFIQDPQAFLSQVGIAPGTSEAMLYENRLMSSEPLGPFVLTNSLAGFLTAWIIIVLGFLAYPVTQAVIDTSDKKRPTVLWIVLSGLWLLMLIMLALTNSRTAWLSCASGSLVVLLSTKPVWNSLAKNIREQKLVSLIVVLIPIGIAASIWSLRPSVFVDALKSLSYRIEYWQGAWKLAMTSPWFGDGACNFQANYNHVKPMTAAESPADPHNFLLETLCAGGFPLAIILMVLLALCLAIAIRSRANGRDALRDHWIDPLSQRSECEPLAKILSGQTMQERSLMLGGCLALLLTSGFAFFLSGDELLYSILIFVLSAMGSFVVAKSYLRTLDLNRHQQVLWIGAGALMLHLVASGGWMLPGVMNSICVLAGCAMAQSNSLVHPMGEQRRSLLVCICNSQWTYISAMVLLLMVSMHFMQSTLLPIRNKTEVVQRWEKANLANLSPEEALTQMDVDPLDPELARYAAQASALRLQDHSISDSIYEKWMSALVQSTTTLQERDPSNWISVSEGGKWLAMASAEFLQRTHGKGKDSVDEFQLKANTHFARAAELYPHSIAAQLQAAVSSVWVGDLEAARRHLDMVEQIEKATPHLDRKLNAATVYFPPVLEAKLGPLDDSARRNVSDGMARGEPVANWIRKHALVR